MKREHWFQRWTEHRVSGTSPPIIDISTRLLFVSFSNSNLNIKFKAKFKTFLNFYRFFQKFSFNFELFLNYLFILFFNLIRFRIILLFNCNLELVIYFISILFYKFNSIFNDLFI